MSTGADAALLARLHLVPSDGATQVAFSGGLDSTVLLHLAQRAGLPELRAVHVHHGLQPAADGWVRHCEDVCTQWQLPLTVFRVAVLDTGQGPEAAAREARYAALRQALPPGGHLLTAHHREDQAETVLLRLLRGTGIEGLAAMATKSPFGAGHLWRPLLPMPREALRAYAVRHGLRWIEDPHNAEDRYARSHLRNQVLPALRSRWPQWDTAVSRTAAHAADATELLLGLASTTLQQWQRPDGGLSLPALRAASPALRRLVMRHWLATQALPAPFADSLERCMHDLMDARPDAQPRVAWPGAELRRYRETLYAGAPLPAPDRREVAWDGKHPLPWPAHAGWLIALRPFQNPLRVSTPYGGERLQPIGDRHTRTLKYLAQRDGLPPWLRGHLPLLWDGQRLLSIAGHWATENAPAIRWQVPAWAGVPSHWRNPGGPHRHVAPVGAV